MPHHVKPCHITQRHTGKRQGQPGQRGSKKAWPETLLQFSQSADRTGQYEQSQWALVPDPGVTLGQEDNAQTGRAPRQLAAVGCGLAGLHVKSMLIGEQFANSSNQPAIGGLVSPRAARPSARSSRIEKIRKYSYHNVSFAKDGLTNLN